MFRIVFPFYRERHSFLTSNPWFRLFAVAYCIGLAVYPILYVIGSLGFETAICHGSLDAVIAENAKPDPLMSQSFVTERAKCDMIFRERWLAETGASVAVTILNHYLMQCIFFVVIMDFLVLRARTNGGTK